MTRKVTLSPEQAATALRAFEREHAKAIAAFEADIGDLSRHQLDADAIREKFLIDVMQEGKESEE